MGTTVLLDGLWLFFGLHHNSHYSAVDVTVYNDCGISRFGPVQRSSSLRTWRKTIEVETL